MGSPAKPRRDRDRDRDKGRDKGRDRESSSSQQEARVLAEFCKHFKMPFRDMGLLKLALTHRSYLSVTGQGPRESNERLEFLGDSVLGLVTSEALYRRHPDEHEGQLTKTKSLLVSKAILSRRALKMGLGRFVLMSHSEVESGGRQRLSILADAFESVLGAIYLDQGFEVSRQFIHTHLLSESDAIVADKRHTNYKSHLQEYVQSTFRTHPVYRIRSENGPDHSKHFMVEVMVAKRTLGEGRGHNKKEAEQAAARDALEKVARVRTSARENAPDDDPDDILPEPQGVGSPGALTEEREGRGRRRGRRGGRSRRSETPLVSDAPRSSRRSASASSESDDDDELVLTPAEPSRALPTPATHLAGPIEDEFDDEDDDDDDEELDASGVIDDEEVTEVDGEDDDEEDDDDEDEDDHEDDDDDEDDDEVFVEPVAAPQVPTSAPRIFVAATPAPVTPQPAPAPVARIAPTETPAEATPVAYGRGNRRAPARRPAAAGPAPAIGPIDSLPAPPTADVARDEAVEHESQRIVTPEVQVEVAPPPAPKVVEPEDDPTELARIEEMERAMENFGRRRSGSSSSRRRR